MKNEYEKVGMFMHAAIKQLAALENPPTVKVLDFGTGSGALVRSLLALGYDAHGCDIKPYWQEVVDAHVERFSTISLVPYRLPYEDKRFGVVISTSVLEHAQNKDELFVEIRRVLKIGGYSMHLFPGKWYLPSEPHIHVPFLNFFWPNCARWWIALWALLGVRNEFQQDKPWKEVAEANYEYCAHGLSYWSNRAYRDLSLKIFGNFSAPMQFYIKNGYGGVPKLLRRLPFQRVTGWVAGEIRTNFIVAQRKQ
jgi:SAM-dependent methyltransferase